MYMQMCVKFELFGDIIKFTINLQYPTNAVAKDNTTWQSNVKIKTLLKYICHLHHQPWVWNTLNLARVTNTLNPTDCVFH